MHTCYSLCTNEVINLGLSNLNHSTRLLHFLALQRCFSAEQMGKGPLMNEWDKYLYPLIQNIMVGGQLSKFWGDRTLRSVVHVTMLERAVSSDRTLSCVRSAPTGHDQSSKTLSGTLLLLTGCWHLEFGHFSVPRPIHGQQPVHAATDAASVVSDEHWCLASGRTLTAAADQMN